MKHHRRFGVGARIHVEGVVVCVQYGVATVRLETGEHAYIHLTRTCELCGEPLPLVAAGDYGTENYAPCPCMKEPK